MNFDHFHIPNSHQEFTFQSSANCCEVLCSGKQVMSDRQSKPASLEVNMVFLYIVELGCCCCQLAGWQIAQQLAFSITIQQKGKQSCRAFSKHYSDQLHSQPYLYVRSSQASLFTLICLEICSIHNFQYQLFHNSISKEPSLPGKKANSTPKLCLTFQK